MIITILFFMLYCVSEGYEDAWYQVTNHWRATLRRIATGICLVYATCGVGDNWVLYLNTGLMYGSIFLVVFNIARNKADGQDWNYIGKTASWDKFLRQFPNWLVWTAFISLMMLSIIVQYFHAIYIVKAEPLINTTWLF
jgi:hypothetical protein